MLLFGFVTLTKMYKEAGFFSYLCENLNHTVNLTQSTDCPGNDIKSFNEILYFDQKLITIFDCIRIDLNFFLHGRHYTQKWSLDFKYFSWPPARDIVTRRCSRRFFSIRYIFQNFIIHELLFLLVARVTYRTASIFKVGESPF